MGGRCGTQGKEGGGGRRSEARTAGTEDRTGKGHLGVAESSAPGDQMQASNAGRVGQCEHKAGGPSPLHTLVPKGQRSRTVLSVDG